MKTNITITDKELSQPIKTTDAEHWVDSLLQKFHDTENNKQYLILRKGLVKEIVDELLPLVKYAKHQYNDPNVFLKFYPGSSQSFDAEFINNNNEVIERVEVTMAINGQNRRIQSEYFIKYSHAPIFEAPNYSGNSKERSLPEHQSSCISSDIIYKNQLSLLQSAYDKKQKNIHKYPNLTLLIGLDLPLHMSFEFQQIINYFKSEENTFKSIKCVSICGAHFSILK